MDIVQAGVGNHLETGGIAIVVAHTLDTGVNMLQHLMGECKGLKAFVSRSSIKTQLFGRETVLPWWTSSDKVGDYEDYGRVMWEAFVRGYQAVATVVESKQDYEIYMENVVPQEGGERRGGVVLVTYDVFSEVMLEISGEPTPTTKLEDLSYTYVGTVSGYVLYLDPAGEVATGLPPVNMN
ncbi:hypothetical protein [Bacillus thuringiensis]|uniref:hypothetical protein n=1 Tax=Bacillus thuringiensis TaxID=1428 RepID=UPI000BFB8C50|nr:hypothetical protein [Bacillus thuringiensis]PGT90105.1 hypothetical protein COD17_10165 [Bacillus thuringiensis]